MGGGGGREATKVTYAKSRLKSIQFSCPGKLNVNFTDFQNSENNDVFKKKIFTNFWEIYPKKFHKIVNLWHNFFRLGAMP